MVKKSIRDASSEGDRENSKEQVETAWASTFDLIQSEYGWSDECILDLTLERITQIVDSILKRLSNEAKIDAQRFKFIAKSIEISSKLVVQHLVSLSPHLDTIAKNSILEEIRKFTLVDFDDLKEESTVEEDTVIYNKASKLMNLHF